VRVPAWSDFDDAFIVHEDEDVIVVDKPAHVPSQAAEAKHDDDVVARLRRHLAARDGVAPGEVYLGVHQRLDRDTSGLLLMARRPEANAALARQFEGRQVDKRYVAGVQAARAVQGQRVLRDVLVRGRGGRMEVAAGRGSGAGRGRGKLGGKLAVTAVVEMERVGERALLELSPRTGRTHQLRVQLAHAGMPIAGDPMYGGAPAMRLLLHAAALRLEHPGGGELSLQAPVPIEVGRWVERGAEEPLDDGALRERALWLALQRRYRLARMRDGAEATTAFRLFHGAGDGSEALAVDLYGEHLVVHVFGAAAERNLEALLDRLEALQPRGIYLKRHPRQKNELGAEGQAELAPPEPVRGSPPEAGSMDGDGEIVVTEHGVPFGVRLGDGLRTGIFLDQRENRRRLRERADGKRLLNLFGYTGGFSVAALAGGAREAVTVDASKAALAWARRNSARVGGEGRHRTIADDAFVALRRMARRGERFDLIAVDPPSYSTSRARRFRVLKDYAELVEAAARVLSPGGAMLCCVNHHDASWGFLQREIRRGLQAAGRQARRVRELPPQIDFPAPPGGGPLMKSAWVEAD
jgi:23S rRNA (cytosine1962-C5)-methyltransferase